MSPEQMQLVQGRSTRAPTSGRSASSSSSSSPGTPPFDAEAVTELVVKIVTEPPPRSAVSGPTAGRTGGGHPQCLEKDRDRRFQTMGELAIALGPFGSKRARASVERVLDTLRVAGLSTSVLPPSGVHRASMAPGGAIPARSTALQWGRTSGRTLPKSHAALGWKVAMGLLALGAVAAGGLLLSRRVAAPSAAATVATAAAATAAIVTNAVPPEGSSAAASVVALPAPLAPVDAPAASVSAAPSAHVVGAPLVPRRGFAASAPATLAIKPLAGPARSAAPPPTARKPNLFDTSN